MVSRHLHLLLLAAGLGLALPAMAAPCYLIIDNKDVVLYRDLAPPFDLSATRSAERDRLRQRGQVLVIAEFEKCNPVGYISTTTGGTTASVDDIVMQLKPAIATSIGAPESPGVVTGFR
jgi:hypothetical protein